MCRPYADHLDRTDTRIEGFAKVLSWNSAYLWVGHHYIRQRGLSFR